ncbi:hypothetical protein Bbelb_057770 [Branchiostoma belcheri]|nr:hypothetical protein Bbelb_057770 [Branchiostoma belcheri]
MRHPIIRQGVVRYHGDDDVMTGARAPEEHAAASQKGSLVGSRDEDVVLPGLISSASLPSIIDVNRDLHSQLPADNNACSSRTRDVGKSWAITGTPGNDLWAHARRWERDYTPAKVRISTKGRLLGMVPTPALGVWESVLAKSSGKECRPNSENSRTKILKRKGGVV